MIQLPQPFQTGDIYVDGPYTHAEVLSVSMNRGPDANWASMEYVLGTESGGVFTAGSMPSKSLSLRGSDFADIVQRDVLSGKLGAQIVDAFEAYLLERLQ